MSGPIFLILALFCIQWTSRALIEHHAGYIYAIWYFYFLLVCITVGIGELGSKFGAIDDKGNFHGEAGKLMSGLLTFAFALNEDLLTALVLVGLILLPQAATYLVGGGLSGVATAPRYATPVVRFALLSLGKSFVVAGAVFLGLGLVGWLVGWPGLEARKFVGLAMMSLTLVMIAFYTFAGHALTDPEYPRDPLIVPRFLRAIHDKMTRNNPKPPIKKPQGPDATLAAPSSARKVVRSNAAPASPADQATFG